MIIPAQRTRPTRRSVLQPEIDGDCSESHAHHVPAILANSNLETAARTLLRNSTSL